MFGFFGDVIGALIGNKMMSAAEEEDQPLTAEQIEAAKSGQAAIEKAATPSEVYEGSQAEFIQNVFLPGFSSIYDTALSGNATRSEVTAQIVPLVSQAQEFAEQNNIPTDSGAEIPPPRKTNNSIDFALAAAYLFSTLLGG